MNEWMVVAQDKGFQLGHDVILEMARLAISEFPDMTGDAPLIVLQSAIVMAARLINVVAPTTIDSEELRAKVHKNIDLLWDVIHVDAPRVIH